MIQMNCWLELKRTAIGKRNIESKTRYRIAILISKLAFLELTQAGLTRAGLNQAGLPQTWLTQAGLTQARLTKRGLAKAYTVPFWRTKSLKHD